MTTRRLLFRLISVERVSKEHGCAAANQKRNSERHVHYSHGNTAKHLRRERSQSIPRMNCMIIPHFGWCRRIGAVLFQGCFVGREKWFRHTRHFGRCDRCCRRYLNQPRGALEDVLNPTKDFFGGVLIDPMHRLNQRQAVTQVDGQGYRDQQGEQGARNGPISPTEIACGPFRDMVSPSAERQPAIECSQDDSFSQPATVAPVCSARR